MGNSLYELLILFVLILINGFFSMSEMAVVSSRKARLQQMAEEGRQEYRMVLSITESPGPFLSTIQTAITLIGTLAGAFGGATVARSLRDLLVPIPGLAPYADAISIGTVVVGITLASIVVGELVPKRIALNAPERIAAKVVHPIRFVSRVFMPVVNLITLLSDLLIRLLGLRRKAEPPVSEEEISILMQQGLTYGLFRESEQEMVERVLFLKRKRPFVFMTPRLEIAYLEIDADPAGIRQFLLENIDYSWIPVCSDGLDDIVGVVETRRLLGVFLEGTFSSLEPYLENPYYIPHSVNALELLDRYRNRAFRVAFVIDEYGGVLGMFTIEDLIDEITGDILQDTDTPQIVKRSGGSFLVDGLLPVEEFLEYFEIRNAGEEGGYHTVAGLVLSALDHIPRTGETVEWEGLKFEILDMDGKRIDKVMVEQFEPASGAENGAAGADRPPPEDTSPEGPQSASPG